ncbi:MAG: hypothetical protein RPR97_01550, partial [Colwellia sp.]
MSNFHTLQISAPKDWQRFEELCSDLWEEIFDSPNAELNGRGGQAQNGIDVFGLKGATTKWFGIQCKGKDGRYGHQVTEAELKAEVEKAKTFEPALSHFILATTAENDANIQAIARKITAEHIKSGLFIVQVKSWDEIQREISNHEKILSKHYPSFSQPSLTHLNNLSKSYKDWQAHDSGRSHGYVFVTDDEREQNFKALTQALNSQGSIVRLTGLSGLGKSRLIIEYIETNQEIDEQNIFVFDASKKAYEIENMLTKAIRNENQGLVIIENCSLELHDHLTVELINNKSNLQIVTINFYEEKIKNSPYIHMKELDEKAVTELITPMLPQFDEHQIKRIVGFVEGYPLLAILIAERFRDEGVLSPELTERDFANKLINADNNLKDEHKRILQVCSLFDVFGVE